MENTLCTHEHILIRLPLVLVLMHLNSAAKPVHHNPETTRLNLYEYILQSWNRGIIDVLFFSFVNTVSIMLNIEP